MGHYHAEIYYPGRTGHQYTEGSKYIPLAVWLLALYVIGWSWMVRPVYDSISIIYIKIVPSNQKDEEQGKLNMADELLL